MKTRRDFVKLIAAAGLVGAAGARQDGVAAEKPAETGPMVLPNDRGIWRGQVTRLASPVLEALARRRLKSTMPVEAPDPVERARYTHLEALGRLLMGLAPWIELGGDTTAEGKERARFAALAREALNAATDPQSPDLMNFVQGNQPLVDAAFVAQALLRAPRELATGLDPRVRANLTACLKATRSIQPGPSNWKLFASMIEAALHRLGEKRDNARLFDGPRCFQQWYVGDGWYGDGAEFHADYYNAFVIHPMLVEVLDVIGDDAPEWREFRERAQARLVRFAAIEERLIAPDGSYPVLGRSITYRCGAFQGLALAALRHQLPKEVAPGQARAALTAVIRRTLEAPGTFDHHGWLRIGLAGHQPSLGENYISTGSAYLCSAAFLPLGLSPTDPFWTEPATATTWQKAWSGVDLPADHALNNPK